jgi:hypothetical protein
LTALGPVYVPQQRQSVRRNSALLRGGHNPASL